MKNKKFYNTLGLSGKNYFKAVQNAKTQSERILTILKFKKVGMTPFEILHEYQLYYPICPVTSIRRSLTDLTEEGLIEKTGTMAMGIYGMPNNRWRTKI